MKKVKLSKKRIMNYGGFGMVANQVGTVIGSTAHQSDGRINTGRNALGTGMQYASMGMSVGGPIGAAIGGIGGGVMGMVQANKRNKEIDKQEALAATYAANNKANASRAVVAAYPTKGYEGTTRFYKKGGIMYMKGGLKVQGGRLNPLSSTSVEGDGATHQQGGIQLDPNMEIENKEVVTNMGDMQVVFSDSLKSSTGGTFAEAAKKIAKQKGKAEDKLVESKTNKYGIGTAKRKMQIADVKEKQLAQEQLEVQLANNINPFGETKAMYGAITPTPGDPILPIDAQMRQAAAKYTLPSLLEQNATRVPSIGNPTANDVPEAAPIESLIDQHRSRGIPTINPQANAATPRTEVAPDPLETSTANKFGQAADRILPYMDNITNAILTAKTPHIPVPTARKALPMNVTHNINHQLDNIDDVTTNTIGALGRMNNNGAGQAGNAIAAQLANIDAKNKLYADKENIETGRHNANIQNAQGVYNQNAAIFDQYKLNKMKRIDDIHGRVSANVADGIHDRQVQIKESNLRDRDRQTLELLKIKYKESGVLDRNLSEAFEKYINKEITFEEFQQAEESARKRKK